MKDANDPGTRDLIDEAPYLVISNTKKGVREFKQPGWWRREPYLGSDYNWTWGKLEKAERFEMSMLPKMLEAVKERRAVTVCVVNGKTLAVLGVTEYPI